MAENEISKSSEKVEKTDQSDRTSENTSKDSVIGGDRKDHQKIHSEASKAGQTFDTFSDNNDDQSFKAIQPAADSFGIDFGDGSIETAKGTISRDVSENPFEEKGQEILKAAQTLKPKYNDALLLGGQTYEPDQLIAAKLTPTNPIRTDATLPKPDEVKDSKIPDNATAQLPDLGKITKDAGEAVIHPHKNELNKFLNVDAAKLATKYFPRLSAHARRNATIGPTLILGIIRNETEHYMRGKDDLLQDGPVSLGGEAPLQSNPTTGPAQVSLKNQKRLAEKYPDLLGAPEDYPKASLSPYFATLLAGALLDDNIQTFEKWDKDPPSQDDLKDKDTRLLYKHAYPKWRDGYHTEAIIRSYNPGDGSRHVRNVQGHIDELNAMKR